MYKANDSKTWCDLTNKCGVNLSSCEEYVPWTQEFNGDKYKGKFKHSTLWYNIDMSIDVMDKC